MVNGRVQSVTKVFGIWVGLSHVNWDLFDLGRHSFVNKMMIKEQNKEETTKCFFKWVFSKGQRRGRKKVFGSGDVMT